MRRSRLKTRTEYLSMRKLSVDALLRQNGSQCERIILEKDSELWSRKIDDEDFLNINFNNGLKNFGHFMQYIFIKFLHTYFNILYVFDQVSS